MLYGFYVLCLWLFVQFSVENLQRKQISENGVILSLSRSAHQRTDTQAKSITVNEESASSRRTRFIIIYFAFDRVSNGLSRRLKLFLFSKRKENVSFSSLARIMGSEVFTDF